MSLRVKGVLVVVAVFAAFALLDQLVQDRVIYNAFKAVEVASAKKDISRCANTINGELESLSNYVYTWSAWDDSCKFVQDHNAEFVASNLTDAAYSGVDIGMMAFYDASGKLVYGKAFDMNHKREVFPQFLVAQAPVGNSLYFHTAIDESTRGILSSPEGMWLICSQPIINSQQTAPIYGTLIMGRLIDAKRMASLKAKTQVDFNLVRFDGSMPPGLSPDKVTAIGNNQTVLNATDDKTLQGYLTLAGLEGQTFLIQARIPRDVTTRGRLSLHWELASLLGLACVVVVMLLVFLETSFFSRILKFKRYFGLVKGSGDLGQTLEISGADELSELADEVNQMLTQLQMSRNLLGQAVVDAQAADEAKGQFLATMSHEIRTPMNGVLGMLSVLLDTPLSAEQRDFAQTAKQSAEGLLRILNDILDFSKLEAGKLEIECIEFNLRSMIEESARIMSVRAAEKNLELLYSLGKDVPERLKGDPGRLRQIIVNLLSNAIKFTRHGEVVLGVELLSRADGVVDLRFKVDDTGIGIPAEQQHRLFKSFSQADSSTTREYGGTGLGLVICQQLAHLMGGEMGFSSISGRGSTFWFSARLEDTAQPEGPRLQTRGELTGKRAIFVDDNATNRRILTAQLGDWGMQVVEASSGDEALRLMRVEAGAGRAFDIALLDFQMPGLDGRELGFAIQHDPALSGIKMVLLTSAGARGDAALMAEAGFSAYLTKPVSEALLKSCILAVLNLTDLPVPAEARIITKHLLREAGQVDLKVLLAEDNKVNQKVAQTLLGRFGLSADTAENGKQALDAVTAGSYDVVLMDCHMPGMDGFEATAAIRALSGPQKKVQIIAMTARAMQGDREECLAAGMNDYVAKPVRVEDLKAAIERCCQVQLRLLENPPYPEKSRPAESAATPPTTAPMPVQMPALSLAPAAAQPFTPPQPIEVPAVEEGQVPIMDIAASIERQGDREFWVELVNVFFEEADKRLLMLKQAVENGNSAEVRNEAHGLKGSASEILAERFRFACLDLEQAAKNQDIGAYATLYSDIVTEFDALWQLVKPHLSAEPVPAG